MSQSLSVECPHCHAKSELTDRSLVGQSIECPACKASFVVAHSTGSPDEAPPATVNAAQPSPGTKGRVESRQRNSQPQRKPRSKIITVLVLGALGGTVAVCGGLIFLGMQFVQTLKNLPEHLAKNGAIRPAPPNSGTSTGDMTATDEAMTSGAASTENQDNMPPEVKARLQSAYGEDATPLLMECLAHPHAGVRERAAELLGYRESNSIFVPPLLKLLKDPSAVVRGTALRALANHGRDSEEAIPAVGAVLLKDPVDNNRQNAAEALARLAASNDERKQLAANLLIPALTKAAAEDRGSIAAAIGTLGDAGKPAIPQLLEMVKNPNSVEADAAMALAELGNLDAFGPMISGKGWNYFLAKIKIAEGLGRQRQFTPQMLDILTKLASDSDNSVRARAIESLATCEPKLPEAIPIIEKAQTDQDQWVRQAAAGAIAKYELSADRKMATLLSQMASAKAGAWERNRICDSIRQLKAEGLKLTLEAAVDAKQKPEVRRAAAEVLIGYWGNESADADNVDRLKELLKDSEQTLNLRTACAIILNRFQYNVDINGLPIKSTFKQAIADHEIDNEILHQALYMIDRQDATVIPLLNDLAQRLEKTLPKNADEEVKSKRDQIRGTVLEAMAMAVSSHPDTETSDILPRYLTAIKTGEPTLKSTAVSQMPSVAKRSPEAIAAAQSLLKHEQSYVRSNALFAIGQMHEHTKGLLPQIQSALTDDDQQVRNSAATALAEFGSDAKDAIPQLLNGLKNNEKTVNPGAAHALARIAPKDPAVVSALIGTLADAEMRDNALAALQVVELDASVVPELRKVMPVSDDSGLSKIFEILIKLGPDAKAALPEMVAQLKNPQGYMRDHALRAIGALKGEGAGAIPALINVIKEGQEDLQITALQTLRQMGEAAKSSIPELEQLAAATDSDMLKSRIQATISRLNSPAMGIDASVIEWLEAGTDWNSMVAEASGETPDSIAQVLFRIAKSDDQELRQRALRFLQNLRYMPGTKKYLQPLLVSDDMKDRALGAIFLGQLPEGDRIELANELIGWVTRHEDFRYAAPQLLGRLGPKAAPVIVNLLTGEAVDSRFRSELLNTMTYLHDRRVGPMLPLLREAAKSDADATQKTAVLALAQLNPREPEILPRVISLMDDDDSVLRQQAVRAIASMASNEVDCRMAVSALMAVVKQPPVQDGEDGQMLDFAVAALLEIGVQADQLPELREALKGCTSAEVEGRNPEYSPAANYGAEIAQLIESLGPAGVEAIPDLKAFYERFAQFRDTHALKRMGEPALAMLSELTESSKPLTRRNAFAALMAIAPTDERTAAAEAKLIDDKDQSVRLQVASQMSRNAEHVEKCLATLRKALREIDENNLHQVLHPLQQLKEQAASAVPDLLELATRQNVQPWTQAAVITTLLAIAPESERVRELFVERLKSANEDYEAINLAAWQPLTIPVLIKIAEEKSNPASRRAAHVLGQFGEKAASAIPALRELLAGDDAETKLAAAIAIIRIDPTAKDVGPTLIAAFNPEKQVEGYYEALRNLGPDAAELLPQLIELAEGEDNYNPMSVIVKLGPAAKPAMPLLISKIYSQDPYAIDQIVEGLGNDAAEVYDRLIEDLNDEDRQLLAMHRLRHVKARGDVVVPRLMQFTESDDLEIRTAALEALGGFDSPEGTLQLAANFDNEDPRIARVAVIAVSQRKPEQLVPCLPQILAALAQHRKSTQFQLLYLIEEMGPLAKETIPALTELTMSTDVDLQEAAERALKAVQAEASDKPE